MSEITLTNDNFEAEVLNSDVPVVVDFWASWCGPCKAFGPILASFAEAHPEVKVGKVNVDEEALLAANYKIMSIPTVLLFKNGEVVNKSLGLIDLPTLEEFAK